MSALKKLPHRRWELLRDTWIDYLPGIDFASEFPGPTIWQIPDTRSTYSEASILTPLPYIEGLRESAFREAIVLCRKFSYCRKVARNSAKNGFSTWSIIATYDACFYAARAFCNLLGFVSIERHSRIFLDLFVPPVTKGQHSHRQSWNAVIAHQLSEPLTHKNLWTITDRLCRTLTMPDRARDLHNVMKSLDFGSISNFRNNLLYDGGFWHNSRNIHMCDLSACLGDLDVWEAINHPPDVHREDFQRYFTLAQKIGDILGFMLQDVAVLAPALNVEANAIRELEWGR